MKKLILALCLAATACGFHLRGPQPLPFDSIYLALSPYTEMGADLRRQIVANGHTRIVDKPADGQVRLQVVTDAREKVILSLDTNGQVREYELRQRFSFKLVDAKGREVIPVTELSTKREVSFNDGQLLAKEQEEIQLYRDMQIDIVRRLLNRLASAHWPLPEEPAQSAPASQS
ncbi:MAG: LPS assembly lipoprotein LptE [Betaproteobacteria bacterium]|nr:LPS assembly lipoprotein LptE [Betaproteobacteria bacterium]